MLCYAVQNQVKRLVFFIAAFISIFKLSQLINFTLSLVGSEVTSIGHKMIETALSHSSFQRIILSKSRKPHFDSCHKDSPVKLVFRSVKRVYVTGNFHGIKTDHHWL
jgi:hypothetical protein